MPKYPFTPELLDAMPEELAELYRGLEDTLLTEICSRLKLRDELNEVTVQDIRALRAHGIDLKDIKKAIQKATGMSEQKLNKLLDDVVKRNQQYYTSVIDLAHITQPETLVSVSDTWAIYQQTKRDLRNINRSMGFLVDNGRTMLPPAKAYQWALDNAAMQVQSGAISYNQAIKTAVKQLADSGLKVVDYESGHHDSIDVAARRAVMTGVSQLCAKYTEQSAEYLETPYYEVSAHAGARDVPGPSPWSSHKDWQGKVYSIRTGDIYPSIYDVCGLGAVDGLEGANCRHRRYPWVEGVSERTYTDEQLQHIDDGIGCEYDGKKYTAYEATQMQRRIERTIRKHKRLKNAYEAAGLTEDATTANIKLRRLNAKYKEFSKAAGLPEQKERMRALYGDEKSEAAAQALKARREAEAAQAMLQNEKNIAILKEKIASGEISTKIRPQVQARHIEGTAEFERYKAQRLSKGQTPQSVMTITMQEAQEFVDKYVGTGTVVVQTQKSGAIKIIEFTDADRVIGRYYKNNAYHNTKRAGIYYSKKGTHVVPTSPKEDK
nr:MAG TPA: minor capsid protein [Caudoviricetes sp.]